MLCERTARLASPDEMIVKRKNHRSNLWFAATDLPLSLPAKLAVGLGLKDVPSALTHGAQFTPGLGPPLSGSATEIRLTRTIQLSKNLYHG